MIDDKKIEEAANKYVDEKYEEIDFYKRKIDFMAGVDWTLKNLKEQLQKDWEEDFLTYKARINELFNRIWNLHPWDYTS